MPADRFTPQSSLPLKPTLASSRTAKTPIAPRLATAPTSASTNNSQSARSARGIGVTASRANTAIWEDTTPVKPLLSSNITPRSSSRKSRAGLDSASSTPGGTPGSTPGSSRPTSFVEPLQKEFTAAYSAPSFVGYNTALHGGRPRGAPAQASSQSSIASRSPNIHILDQPAPQKKAPVFFYANGKQDESVQNADASPVPFSNIDKAQSTSKIFSANSLAGSKQSSLHASPLAASAIPTLSPDSSATHGQIFCHAAANKDMSNGLGRKGVVQDVHSTSSSRNSVAFASPGSSIPDTLNRSGQTPNASLNALRLGHSKSASLSSIDSVTADFKTMPPHELTSIQRSPLRDLNYIAGSSHVPERTAATPPLRSAPQSPIPLSPVKAASDNQSALEVMNELAANARRERKVLDLEISNSSLLVINRSLEKEVRKQKTELRRFRRMSRAGRFSVGAVDSVHEVSSVTDLSNTGHLSDVSGEEKPELEEEEEEVESSASSVDEDALSPTAQAEWYEAHRMQDEKRLQLDLSKHRELLIDSQKMNQSLKRCMNWTEQLIQDGQKALAYQVRVSDVKLGGKVLISEDDNSIPEAGESQGLLSPWSPLHEAMEALESPFFAEPDRGIDRDSGVDVEGHMTKAFETSNDANRLKSLVEERIELLQQSINAI